MSVAPAVSEYCKLKIWEDPVPELGVTDTTWTCVGTVQAPSCFQAAVPNGRTACMQTPLLPPNAGWNVRARFSVRTVPVLDTLDPLPLRVHWLFSWLPLPGVMVEEGCPPESVNSARLFCARL